MVIARVSLAIGLAAVCSFAGAEDLGIQRPDLEKLDPAILKQVTAIREQGAAITSTIPQRKDLDWVEHLAPNSLQSQEAPTGAISASNDAEEGGAQGRAHPLGEGAHTLIFVSWSMGAAAIQDILVAYDGVPGVGVVFRGVPDGMPMAQAVAKMQRLTQVTKASTPILLDPLAFERFSISAVPSIARETPAKMLVAVAAGSSSESFLQAKIAEGKHGDLGTVGPTTEILEPDLMDVAKQRIAQLDTDGMKKRAIARFWDQQQGTPLPPVTTSTRREVDPSVIIPQDILDPSGKVLVKAGKLNPLDIMPFGMKLVVIDPAQRWQVELAKQEVDNRGQLAVTTMATHIASSSEDGSPAGWDLFNQVQDTIEAPLYLLPADLAARFQILRAPSIVTAEGKHFVVSEVARDSLEERADAQ